MVKDDSLVLRASSGKQETEHTRIKIGKGICGLAAQTGNTIMVPDVSRDLR
jgi:putative methionine-R-sulfoxide reductase with GAF domain